MRLKTSWLGKDSWQAWNGMGWDGWALGEADAWNRYVEEIDN